MPKDTFLNLNEEKQETIMRTAIKEFMDKGFEKGNIGEIAKNAGVAKGSMYQYFENKKELFLYSVQWSLQYFMKKYNKYLTIEDKNISIFDFFYQNAKNMWIQMRDERDIVIFIQDVFLGKYRELTDESMKYMMKFTDEYVLTLIRDGKKKGYIRSDISDKMLSFFITGASMKFKEYMMNNARDAGEDILDEDFEVHEKEISELMDLLKNGMSRKD